MGRYLSFSCISSLCKAVYPSAITGFIIAEWINSINACTRRTFSHVFQKCFKFSPSRAHSNANSTVIFIERSSRKVTTRKHSSPRNISRGRFYSWAMTMFCIGFASKFMAYAATTNRIATAQRGSTDRFCFSTFAFCYPRRWAFWLRMVLSNNYPISECFPRDINYGSHGL